MTERRVPRAPGVTWGDPRDGGDAIPDLAVHVLTNVRCTGCGASISPVVPAGNRLMQKIRHVCSCGHINWIDPTTREYDPEVPDCMKSTAQLLAERSATHGRFDDTARIAQMLRKLFRAEPGWTVANERQREALDMIALKLSRILSGKPSHADHWDDIAGYAKLAGEKTDAVERAVRNAPPFACPDVGQDADGAAAG